MRVFGRRSAAIAMWACASGSLFSSPIIGIGEGKTTSWTTAVGTGLIVPLGTGDPIDAAATAFYTGLATSLGLTGITRVDALLTPDILVSDSSGETHLSLVKSSDPPTDPGLLGVSEWKFAYVDDPDLNGTSIRLEIEDPVGVLGMGIQLVDRNGRARGWFREHPDEGWDPSYSFNPQNGLQGPFTFFFNEPGFDLSQVLQIRVGAGINKNFAFPVPDPTGKGQAWDATAFIEVVPEPGTLIALAPALFWMRKRLRRATRGHLSGSH
jgi:hypothetical protein